MDIIRCRPDAAYDTNKVLSQIEFQLLLFVNNKFRLFWNVNLVNFRDFVCEK